MPKKRIKATLEDIANELSDQSEVLAGLQTALAAQAATLIAIQSTLNASAVKQTALAGKLHDTQALILQNTRSIANG